jgi:GH15 family glucan-1,4-alpha-glucosidase
LFNKAQHILQQLCSAKGIVASTLQTDNYNRVWSRDGMMTALTGLMLNDIVIIKGLLNTIETLAAQQSLTGAIPSNVYFNNNKAIVSYGTHVGRVDATTWWLIGTLSYALIVDGDIAKKYQSQINKALELLDAYEYNGKHLIYTPLGGNWADEYICNGYTLYDNVLRYASLKLAYQFFKTEILFEKINKVKLAIEYNFIINPYNDNPKYHQKAFDKIASQSLNYMPPSLNAHQYDTYWDMAGNALALLWGLLPKEVNIVAHLNKLNQEFNHWMLPVFYPIIKPIDDNWKLLQNNFSYNFKNIPYQFHNGGAWPIFLGWLCLGLNTTNDILKHNIASGIKNNLTNLLEANPADIFNEYYDSKTLVPMGVQPLGFSASGYILMHLNPAENNNFKIIFL